MLNNNNWDSNKPRGRYRTMDMKELFDHANDKRWHDGEQSRINVGWPLPLTPWKDGHWTFKNWKQLAERHIVDRKRAPYKLTDDVPEGELYELGGFWCCKSPGSHMSCFLQAIDFLVPDGTRILASADGWITELVEYNDEWGDEKDENGDYIHRDHLNFMTVHVGGMERMQYCHIAKESVSAFGLKVGSYIKRGQPIGKVGKNGLTDRDHLHFIVFREDVEPSNPFGFKSLIPRFTTR
jgi:murein DD-endopeptidase MepM/ murein hydrolase activator NlpD